MSYWNDSRVIRAMTTRYYRIVEGDRGGLYLTVPERYYEYLDLTDAEQLRLDEGLPVPACFAVCGTCSGHGTVVNPSIDCDGISDDDFRAGKITLEQVQASQPPRPRAVYTAAGDAAAKAFNSRSPQDNPWFACKPTSFIRDWTADWPINQFVQSTTAEGEKVIDITYGLYNFKRRIHVGMQAHPANLTPSYAGHSIGNWEGDVLVVDTVGFEPGVLSPPTRSSDQMHIVERFSLDTAKMALKREYSVTDPVYLAEPYASYDVMYLSDVPFEAQTCKEMTPEFAQPQQ
ncbi:MAG: hypothetical protein ACO280_06690 [Pseudohongiellaceae bacterium]